MQIILNLIRSQEIPGLCTRIFGLLGRVNFYQAIEGKLAEIFEADITLFTGETVETSLLILETHLDLYLIEGIRKVLEIDLVLQLYVEKTECFCERVEFLLESLPDQIKAVSQIRVVLKNGFGVRFKYRVDLFRL